MRGDVADGTDPLRKIDTQKRALPVAQVAARFLEEHGPDVRPQGPIAAFLVGCRGISLGLGNSERRCEPSTDTRA